MQTLTSWRFGLTMRIGVPSAMTFARTFEKAVLSLLILILIFGLPMPALQPWRQHFGNC